MSPIAAGAESPRELSDAAFAAAYGGDRFTATVLTSRFRHLVRHVCTHLMTNAFSPVLRDWYDFSCTLSGPPDLGYPMSAVADTLLLFTGTMADATRNISEEFGPEDLSPGDILVCNDPYRKGTHVNDVCFLAPIFAAGELVGFINLTAHMMDMGGTVPGGFGATKRNVYENGVVIAPQLLYRGGRPVRSAFSLIFDNARFGELILPDIRSIAASLRLGERMLGGLIDQYGTAAYRGALTYATDLGAFAMREALERLPDGVYEGTDAIDCDGVDAAVDYGIAVRIQVAAGRCEVDLSGTSGQARTCINAGWLDTKTAVAVALKFLIDPHTPYTSGLCRQIDIVLPPATILSAMPPDGAIFAYWEATMPLVHAIFRALEAAVGEAAIAGDFCSAMTHNATGRRADGSAWAVVGGTCGGEHGPAGATAGADGENSLATTLANGVAPSVEGLEAEAPVVMMRKEYVTDSAGAGARRGGAATRKDTLWLEASDFYTTNMHVKAPSGFGVRGGGDGLRPAVWKWEPDELGAGAFVGDAPAELARATPILGVLERDSHSLTPNGDLGAYFHFGREDPWTAASGAMLRYQTSGGGGWGDPLARDPDAVLRDVRDEYVSPEAAERLYGVVVEGDPAVDPETLWVDVEATEKSRAALRENRDTLI